MPWTSEHMKWLVDTGERLNTVDGKIVEVWEFHHEQDDDVLSAWAKHFRNHYCLDDEIDCLREGTGLSRSEYLKQMLFPDRHIKPGPSIRSGDFAEILVADYLRYILNYWVPNWRYDDKAIRNESKKGVDILAFKFISENESAEDVLAVYESKAKLTGTTPVSCLQDAVNGSQKDIVRTSQSLNALKRRLIKDGSHDEAANVQRFQNKADKPYKYISGAVATLVTSVYSESMISTTNTTNHSNRNDLSLLIIKGDRLMDLVHSLYERAADEA